MPKKPRQNNDIRWEALDAVRPRNEPGQRGTNVARRELDRQAKKAGADQAERNEAYKQVGLWGKTEAEKKKGEKPKKKGGGLW